MLDLRGIKLELLKLAQTVHGRDEEKVLSTAKNYEAYIFDSESRPSDEGAKQQETSKDSQAKPHDKHENKKAGNLKNIL